MNLLPKLSSIAQRVSIHSAIRCGRKFFFLFLNFLAQFRHINRLKLLFSLHYLLHLNVQNIVHFCQILFREIKECFDKLSENPDCRVIVVSGAGKLFTAGLDLKEAMTWGQKVAEIDDPARKGQFFERTLIRYQVLY